MSRAMDTERIKARGARAKELWSEPGATLEKVSKHPDIGPISRERIRQLIDQADRLVQRDAETLAAMQKLTSGDATVLEEVSTQDLPVSVRARNAMHWSNIQTIGQLIQITPSEFMKKKNAGRKTLVEIQFALGVVGLRLKDDPVPEDGSVTRARRMMRDLADDIERRMKLPQQWRLRLHLTALRVAARRLQMIEIPERAQITRSGLMVVSVPPGANGIRVYRNQELIFDQAFQEQP